jgi:hypothetical protein
VVLICISFIAREIEHVATFIDQKKSVDKEVKQKQNKIAIINHTIIDHANTQKQ